MGNLTHHLIDEALRLGTDELYGTEEQIAAETAVYEAALADGLDPEDITDLKATLPENLEALRDALDRRNEPMTWRGEPCFIVVIDEATHKVVGSVRYRTAEAWDFHEDFFLPAALAAADDVVCVFVDEASGELSTNDGALSGDRLTAVAAQVERRAP